MIYSQNFVRDKVSVFESRTTPPATVNKFEANEIYNNPKFNIEESSESSRPYSSVVKKKGDSFDQYASPVKRTAGGGKPDTNMPDMIYEAIEMEKKNKPINYALPTPDYYSSEYEMMKFKKVDNVSFIPFVPTPDYHTYGKNSLRSLKQYQPDSPIYSRKSPAYLVVDYETDSLERTNTFKHNRTPISTPTRSDFSSQPSPSALPMEEEVEIRNAIYDKQEGFRKDTDTIKKEREIDIQMKKTKIMYNTPNEGSMTIELEAISPDENDDVSLTESDQFEPDTLDRHAKKNKTVLERIKMERKNNIENESRDEMGRLMTLEVRHSKRQRNMGFASLEKLPEKPQKIIKPVPAPSKVVIIPPDVISSNKPLTKDVKSFQSSPPPCITNKHILNEHEFKKSQISPPILTSLDGDKKMNKTLRGEFLKMDILKLDTNFHENQMRHEFQPSLIKTVYHVELPSPPKEVFTDTGKKSKDFKNAWRRFIGIAEKNSQSGVNTEIKQGKVKDIIKRLNVVQGENGKPREYDSGYLSAESVSNDPHLNKYIPKTENNDLSPKVIKTRPLDPPPPVPQTPVPSLVRSNYLNNDDLVNINIYSSDEDEAQSSIPDSDDDFGLLDDGTESGTESWKFFKT
jgi:hypothetical protein